VRPSAAARTRVAGVVDFVHGMGSASLTGVRRVRSVGSSAAARGAGLPGSVRHAGTSGCRSAVPVSTRWQRGGRFVGAPRAAPQLFALVAAASPLYCLNDADDLLPPDRAFHAASLPRGPTWTLPTRIRSVGATSSVFPPASRRDPYAPVRYGAAAG